MLEVCLWADPPLSPELSDREVHLWQADLKGWDAEVERLSLWLSADEQQRAARFRFERDRRKFILSRGILRHILSQYLQQDPIAFRFEYGTYGKPSITSGNWLQLSFNLAHAGDRVIYAITQHHAIGIDIEQIRPVSQADQIVNRYFSPVEQQAFQSLPSDQHLLAFFRAWTGKEAFLKAIGSGLSLPLDQVAVAILPDQAVELLSLPADYAVSQWKLHQFIPAEGYVGAIVMPQKPLKLHFWEIS